MDVDLRPTKKLRESAAARSALGPIMEAVCSSPADLASLRVVCDWIQYKQNFRAAVVATPVATSGVEIAFDLRRCGDMAPETLAAHVKQALTGQPGLALEPWVPGRDSCIWRFNALYWQALSGWERATGREYEQSLPSGESDGRNTEAARELILELFRIWDELAARRALPEELYIRRRAAPGQRRGLLPGPDSRRSDPAAGQDRLLRLLRRRGQPAAARAARGQPRARPGRRFPVYPPAHRQAGQVLLHRAVLAVPADPRRSLRRTWRPGPGAGPQAQRRGAGARRGRRRPAADRRAVPAPGTRSRSSSRSRRSTS